MSLSASTAVRAAIEDAMRGSRLRGMVVGVARGGGGPEYVSLGADSLGNPAASDSLFPVASITKLATALAVLRLADRGMLSVDDPLAYHLPEAVSAAHLGVTFRRILSHTSGLPLDIPPEEAPYEEGLDRDSLSAACLRVPLQRSPGMRVQYSNVGYGLLGLAVERLMGEAYPSALSSLVLGPLGIEGYLGAPPPRPVMRLSGVSGPHAKTPIEPFNSEFWRSLGMSWGGLITTAQGALSLLRAFTGIPRGFLSTATLAQATANQAGDLPGGFVKPLIWKRSPWGLGPELRDEKSPHWAPPQAAANSYGHSGASGTVAWHDPATGVSWTILGTRVAAGGWLVRHGPRIGAAILAAAA